MYIIVKLQQNDYHSAVADVVLSFFFSLFLYQNKLYIYIYIYIYNVYYIYVYIYIMHSLVSSVNGICSYCLLDT